MDQCTQRAGKSFRTVNTSACVLCSYADTHAHAHTHTQCMWSCVRSHVYCSQNLHILLSHTSTVTGKEGAPPGLSFGCSRTADLLCVFLGIDFVSILSETNPRTLKFMYKVDKFLYNLAHPPISLEASPHFITASTMQMVIMLYWLEGNDSETSSWLF